MPKIVWTDSNYVKAFELARTGLGDNKIAAALGVTATTFRKWRDRRPAFKEAIEHGRKINAKQADHDFRSYIFNRLPKRLRKLWKKINRCETAKNGMERIEALLADAGKRARQHLFLYALTASNFNISAAMRTVCIDRETFEHWVAYDPDFGAMMDQIHEYKKDFFESGLLNLVAAGDTSATIFANKTFNRDRYPDKIDVNLNGSMRYDVNVVPIDKLDLPLDVRKKVLKAIRKQKQKEGETE